jgi:hypothetical protein
MAIKNVEFSMQNYFKFLSCMLNFSFSFPARLSAKISFHFSLEKTGIRNYFKFLTLASVFLVLAACEPKDTNPAPPDLVEKTEMISVITDMTLSEAALAGEPLAGFNDTLKKINVLREHNLSNERFLSSFDYYTKHPKILKEIYDSVAVTLERRKALPGK